MITPLLALLAPSVPQDPVPAPRPIAVLARGEPRSADGRVDGDGNPWVRASDLERLTGFELREEGLCAGELCVPLPGGSAERVRRAGDPAWVSLLEVAGVLGQGIAAETERGLWSFSEPALARASTLESGRAPDFELPDLDGVPVRLSALRGRKVLLVTFASW